MREEIYADSFDHLVGSCVHNHRHVDTQRACDLEVDDEENARIRKERDDLAICSAHQAKEISALRYIKMSLSNACDDAKKDRKQNKDLRCFSHLRIKDKKLFLNSKVY